MTARPAASAAFLHVVTQTPHLLDWAPLPGDLTEQMITDRARGGIPFCLRCEWPAQVAVIVLTPVGPRWLDLCDPCRGWLDSEPARPVTIPVYRSGPGRGQGATLTVTLI